MSLPERFPPDGPVCPWLDRPVSEEAQQDGTEIARAVIQWAEELATCRED